ncbi:MAG: hypothetical protein JW910_18575 [Anaerolineae bacterium]|nr:hypothetical protein [Anaerolineae bacterium]
MADPPKFAKYLKDDWKPEGEEAGPPEYESVKSHEAIKAAFGPVQPEGAYQEGGQQVTLDLEAHIVATPVLPGEPSFYDRVDSELNRLDEVILRAKAQLKDQFDTESKRITQKHIQALLSQLDPLEQRYENDLAANLEKCAQHGDPDLTEELAILADAVCDWSVDLDAAREGWAGEPDKDNEGALGFYSHRLTRLRTQSQELSAQFKELNWRIEGLPVPAVVPGKLASSSTIKVKNAQEVVRRLLALVEEELGVRWRIKQEEKDEPPAALLEKIHADIEWELYEQIAAALKRTEDYCESRSKAAVQPVGGLFAAQKQEARNRKIKETLESIKPLIEQLLDIEIEVVEKKDTPPAEKTSPPEST